MLKILIADDEPFIREGLMELVDWKMLGFEICEIAIDGDDALEKIIKHQPHVVLIDIKMPGLTGIEVIRKTRARGLNCQFIVLSGYSDFEYAKESINLNVHDYLLKPITENDLISVSKNVHEKILNEQQTTAKLRLYQQFEQETSLKKLLRGELDIVLSEQTAKNSYQIAFIKDTANKEAWITHLIQSAPTMNILQHSEGIVLFFVNMDEKKTFDILRAAIRKYQFKLALSDPFLSATDLADAYAEVKKLMERLFCFRDESLLTQKMIPVTMNEAVDVEKLYLAIEFSDQIAKAQAQTDLENYYKGKDSTSIHIKGRLTNFQALLFQKFSYTYSSLTIFEDERMQHQFQEQETLQDILELMLMQWNLISSEIKKQIDISDDGVKKVQHYVKRYYHQDLSLKIVSKILNYNATYLGKKFKLETGESFSKYVDRIRIEKAQTFLGRDKMKVYEVAEKVGYCNIDYFYRKFKNHTGKSPKEWQKEYLAHQKIEEVLKHE